MQEIELDNSIMDHITKKSIIAISNLHALGNSLSNSFHMNIHNHHHTIDQHRHNPAFAANHPQNTHNLILTHAPFHPFKISNIGHRSEYTSENESLFPPSQNRFLHPHTFLSFHHQIISYPTPIPWIE